MDAPVRHRRSVPLLVVGMTAALCGSIACRSERQVLEEQRQAVVSLRATAAAIGNAWLAGTVSATYARTALEATQQLVEKQRTELTASPARLAQPDALALAEAENHLAEGLAGLWKAIDAGNADEARRHLAAVAASGAQAP